MMSKPSQYKELLNKAVQLLAQRNHSALELKNKLLAFYHKKYANDEPTSDEISTTIPMLIDEIISECSAKKWLNEDDYIEQYIIMRVREGYGKNRILLELKQRGLVTSAILHTMSLRHIDWIEIGVTQLNKKFRCVDKKDLQQKSKIFQFLSYRGFSQEQINIIYSSC